MYHMLPYSGRVVYVAYCAHAFVYDDVDEHTDTCAHVCVYAHVYTDVCAYTTVCMLVHMYVCERTRPGPREPWTQVLRAPGEVAVDCPEEVRAGGTRSAFDC